MQALRVEFLGGPRDGGEIPARYLVMWSVGGQFSLDERDYRFEELADGRRIARFLGYTKTKRSP
jgi:hypothetical protein